MFRRSPHHFGYFLDFLEFSNFILEFNTIPIQVFFIIAIFLEFKFSNIHI